MSESKYTYLVPKVEGVDIVAIGNFNPAIFHPLWFSSNNLVREAEAQSAEVKIIHKDVAVFAAEWFSLQVTDDRFVIETKDPTKFQPLRDLAVGTFKLLEHTPIISFGINRHQVFEMPSEIEWHAFGDYYAPKDSWRKLLLNPGMRGVVIEGKREGSEAALITIRIEPGTNLEVFVHVNEHYQISSDISDGKEINAFFLSVLQNSWDGFISYSEEAGRVLLTDCSAERN